MIRPPERLIAFHEAGHAVVAWFLGARVLSVSLHSPVPAHIGHVLYELDGDQPLTLDAVILCAGPIAELGSMGDSWAADPRWVASMGQDHEQVRSLGLSEAELAGAIELAALILTAEWPRVLVVAALLIAKDDLDGAELERAMSRCDVAAA